MNTHIGHEIFQNIPRRAAKFCKNQPRDVEKSVVGNKKITRQKHNSLPLLLQQYVGDCNQTEVS